MAMFRITSSKVVPYAVRAISSRGALFGSITNAINGCDQNSSIIPIAISHHQFSTDAMKQIDDKLVKIIKSEIKLKQMFVQKGDMPPNPDKSPFTFQDNPWDEHVTLSRDFDEEKIEVVVTMPYGRGILEDYDDKIESSRDADVSNDISSSDDDDEDVEKDETPRRSWHNLLLKVTVSKKNGKIMEFNVLAFADGETMVRDYTVLKEAESETSQPMRRSGPHSVKEGDLENALLEYIKVRGITRSNYVFLYDYMLKKCQRSPVVTLKELKKFIAH